METKACTKCNERKSITEFNFKIKRARLRQYQCIVCTRSFARDHYKRNRRYYLDRARKRNEIKRLETKEYIKKYLAKHPCIDCKESDIVVLEFDHKSRNAKFKEVADLIRRRYPLPKIKEEIRKCVVRCANCHRRKTANVLGWLSRS